MGKLYLKLVQRQNVEQLPIATRLLLLKRNITIGLVAMGNGATFPVIY